MRILRSIVMFIVLSQLLHPHAVSADSSVPSGLAEQRFVFVAEGESPTPRDVSSRTLEPITPDAAFDTILLTWSVSGNAHDITLRVRFATGDNWSDWVEVTHNPEFVPETAPRNVYASTPFELNALHTAWQLDIILASDSPSYLASLSAVTMNNLGANPRNLPLPSAAARTARGTKPPIVSRDVWGDATLASWDANAAPWSGYCNASSNAKTWVPATEEITPASHVVIHHTAGGNYDPYSHNWAASVLGIWRYHAMQLGWCDIGYHYLIDPNGVIYEGRYTGVRDDGNVIDGAHALGHNRSTIGIAFMGNFQSVEPSDAAIQALDNLLGWIGSSKNIPFNTEQFYAYKNKTLNTIVGHRDVGSTVCPGNMLYAKLPEIRQRAALNSIRPNDALWIKAVSANQTTLVAGDVLTVRMTVQNMYSTIPISSAAFTFGNADAGFTYDQTQCWALKTPSDVARFPRPDNVPSMSNQRFRVIAGVQGWDSSWANKPSSCPVASTIDHPWRWSIGSTPLAPGATRVITGRIRFTVPGTYTMMFGLVKDWVGYPDMPCNRAQKLGACQLNPITIRVIKPSPTYAPDVQTQVVVNTATHARLQTQVSLNQTRTAADRINATREVQRGLPSRTPTATRIFPTPTPIPVMQSVIALRTATQLVSQFRTATARAALTNTVSAAQLTHTAIQLTQVADESTASAEPATRTTTSTPTVTTTPTRTQTASRTATRTSTPHVSRTPTKTPTPIRLLDPTSISSVSSRMPIGHLEANATHVWVLRKTNPPMLIAYDPISLTQLQSIPVEGVNVTLMRINQHNSNELFVVGRYAWDLLAVQRFSLTSGTPVRTGVWLYKTMANPIALVSTDRYVYLAVNHAAQQNTPATAEIIILHNRNVFTEATGRRRIPGAITDMRNLDSADLTVIAAGRNLDNTGFIIPVAVNRALDLKSRIQLPKPPQTLSTFMITPNLVPAMLVVSSDTTSWARIGYTISTQKLAGLQQQPLTARSPLLWRGQPFISLSTSPDRLQLFAYTLSNNTYQLRYTEHVGRLGSAEIQFYATVANQLYWHDGQRLYRAVMTIP